MRLEYEAYEPMAIAEIKKICVQLREKWQVENIGVVHRLVDIVDMLFLLNLCSLYMKMTVD